MDLFPTLECLALGTKSMALRCLLEQQVYTMGGGGGTAAVCTWDSTIYMYVRSMWSSGLVMALVLRFAGINRSSELHSS